MSAQLYYYKFKKDLEDLHAARSVLVMLSLFWSLLVLLMFLAGEDVVYFGGVVLALMIVVVTILHSSLKPYVITGKLFVFEPRRFQCIGDVPKIEVSGLDGGAEISAEEYACLPFMYSEASFHKARKVLVEQGWLSVAYMAQRAYEDEMFYLRRTVQQMDVESAKTAMLSRTSKAGANN